jgi:hypothetical protein
MIRKAHLQLPARRAHVALFVLLLFGGGMAFGPAVLLAIHYFHVAPAMAVLTLAGAVGWLVCIVWFGRTLRTA